MTYLLERRCRRAVASPLFLLLALLVGALPAEARADGTKAACADAYSSAQSLRDAQKLLRAREQLRVCARPSCTQFISRDCATWLGELESRIPSVVLFARDANGADVGNVVVSIDGTVLVQQLDGHAVDVDAGRHTFTFVFPDGTKVDQTYVVLEGQKAQRVGVSMAPPTQPSAIARKTATATGVGPASATESKASSWSARKTGAVVVGVAGLAAAGVGSYFGILAKQNAQAQDNACPYGQPCAPPPHDAATKDHADALTHGIISDAAFAAGGVLVATGIVLLATAPKSGEPGVERPTSLGWAPSVGPRGGGLSFWGVF